jgi:transcriptional regulator with XRE-family HTH domain
MSAKPKDPNSIRFNIHVGTKLRNIRLKKQLNQSKVASEINVTFQQIQKYEKGANGLSAFLMGSLAHFFDVQVSYFTEGFNFENFTSHLKYEDKFPEINRCNQVRNEKLYPNPNSYNDISDSYIEEEIKSIEQ